MSRNLLRLIPIVVAASLAALLGCPKKNQAPGIPSSVSGPSSGDTGKVYAFAAASEDPDGDSISLQFNWGDSTKSDWSPAVASGQSAGMTKAWSNVGNYQVKARAKDMKGAESDWSNADTINIIAASVTRPAKPVVQYEVSSPGDVLELHWDSIPGADGYYVYLDGVRNPWAYTFGDVEAPTKLIQVTAYADSVESDTWSLNTGIVKTTALQVDDVAGAGPNFAFYFNASGTAIAIPLSQAADIDFVLDTTMGGPELISPDGYSPPYNSKDNSAIAATTTNFDTLAIAAGPGEGYTTVLDLTSGALYSLWIDPTANGWSTDDHFAKMKVESINGNTLTLTLGYQMIGGLRWLMNP